MIYPTLRAVAAFGALALLGLLGYVGPWGADVLIAADALLVLLVVFDGARAARLEDVTVTRDAPDSFSVGRETVAAYRWENRAPRPARLLAREVRPERLGGVAPPRAVRIPARGAVREEQPLHPLRRGKESVGWLALRSVGPLGLGFRRWKVDLPWSVVVYPSLPASRLKASIAEAVRKRETGLKSVRRLGEGRQFESLREWVPGDDVRSIDWKATARRRKVITRQFEEERRQQVLLVLDAGRLLTAHIDGQARFEFVVRAALWLAFAANHHDDNVGIMVFADGVDHYVTPQRGRRGLRQVLDVLAVAEPKLVEPDYPAAFRYLAVKNRKRALTVLFSDVIDRTASEALVANVASLRPRHLPLVVTLRNPDLDAVAASRPTEVAGAYRKAAAENLLASREEALAQMRRTGAIVLDVQPEQASRGVVDAYLELKRRGRL